jgi:hypothetical protein
MVLSKHFVWIDFPIGVNVMNCQEMTSFEPLCVYEDRFGMRDQLTRTYAIPELSAVNKDAFVCGIESP